LRNFTSRQRREKRGWAIRGSVKEKFSVWISAGERGYAKKRRKGPYEARDFVLMGKRGEGLPATATGRREKKNTSGREKSTKKGRRSHGRWVVIIWTQKKGWSKGGRRRSK